MAQLKDSIVSGNLRVTDTTLTDTLQTTTIQAPSTSGGTTYGPGTNGQVLKSNGTTTYWADDSNTDTKVNVTLATTTKAYLLGTSTTPTGTAQAVTSLADTGVYLGTTAGSLYATTFYGSLSGTAAYADELNMKILTAETLDTTPGSYVFKGSNLFGGIHDWAGLQVDASNDRFQLVTTNINQLMFRQNDGPTIADPWNDWVGCLTPANVIGESGITVTQNDITIGSGETAFKYKGSVTVKHSNTITASSTTVFKKFSYDTNGHITGTADVDASDLPSHTHSYIPMSGSMDVTGNIEITKASGYTAFYAKRSDTDVRIGLQVSTEGVNHGLWSSTINGDKYLLYSDGTDSYIYTTTAEPASNTTLYPIAFFAAEASNAEKKIQHNDGLRYLTQAGTTSTVGQAYLVVGNATASGTAGNKKGVIRIYSQNKGYYQLDPTSTSSNITLTLPNTTGTVALDRASFITEAALTYSDTTSWHKFAQFTSSTATEDRVIVFIVSSTYYSSTSGTVGAKSGILIAHIRTTSTKALSVSSSELTWLVAGSNINNTHFKMLYYNLDSSCRIELWCKVPEKYVGWVFNVIDEHSRTTRAKAWTLYTNSSSGQAGVALPTDASGSIDSTYQAIKNPYVS